MYTKQLAKSVCMLVQCASSSVLCTISLFVWSRSLLGKSEGSVLQHKSDTACAALQSCITLITAMIDDARSCLRRETSEQHLLQVSSKVRRPADAPQTSEASLRSTFRMLEVDASGWPLGDKTLQKSANRLVGLSEAQEEGAMLATTFVELNDKVAGLLAPRRARIPGARRCRCTHI